MRRSLVAAAAAILAMTLVGTLPHRHTQGHDVPALKPYDPLR